VVAGLLKSRKRIIRIATTVPRSTSSTVFLFRTVVRARRLGLLDT
jgi:hypothetical protein